MSGMVLADDSLINLFPDPAWDVAGFRDLAGGVIAVCLYAAVAMVIVGVLTLLPGLITNNMFYGRGSRDWRYCWVLAWFRRVRAVVRRVVGDVRR